MFSSIVIISFTALLGSVSGSTCSWVNTVCCKFGNLFGNGVPNFYGRQCAAKMEINDHLNTMHPIFRRTLGGVDTIYNDYCQHPVSDCGADPSVIVGCRSMSGRTVVPRNIYACSGTFYGGGVYGAGAAHLCSDGYQVCESAQAAEALGLTEEICYDEGIFDDRAQFFASKETSNGYGRCYSGKNEEYIPGQNDANDIWGCGHPDPTLPLRDFDCKVNGKTVMKKMMSTWKDNVDWKNGNSYNEATTMHLTNARSGGVLCCRK